MNLNTFCGICLKTPENLDECVMFKSKMEAENFNEEITYLDCFEVVTHLKIDINVIQNLHLCSVCRYELENSFSFLRKAEKSQRLLYEKIELEQHRKQTELNQDLDLNAEAVLTDAMLGTNSTDYFDAFSENVPLHCENSIDNVPLSPLSSHEDHLKLPDDIIPTDDIKLKILEDDESLKNEIMEINKTFNCNLCAKTFDTYTSLRTHLKYHKRKTARTQSDACRVCSKTFSTASYLRQHMQLVHADERQQFKCDECEKIYFTKSALRNHKRFHTGETITCTECQKSFVTQYDLKIHMRFHQRNYPFACTICDQKFAIKGHLSTHMWEHQGLKLQCDTCGKLFSSTKALLDHSFVHTGAMPYPCSYCKKSYPSKQKYKVHLMSLHKIEFDELEHTAKTKIKSMPRRKNLTLVQTDSVVQNSTDPIKNEVENFNEIENSFDEVVLEVT